MNRVTHEFKATINHTEDENGIHLEFCVGDQRMETWTVGRDEIPESAYEFNKMATITQHPGVKRMYQGAARILDEIK